MSDSSIRALIDALLVLQERDERVARLQAELAQLPHEEAALLSRLRHARETLETTRARFTAAELERKRCTLDADSLRSQIARYRNQQLQTRKNEEYQALTHEIAHAEEKITAIEDQELQLMEQLVGLEQQLAAAQETFARAEESAAQEKATLLAKRTRLEEEIAQAIAQQAAAEEPIDPVELRRYRRIATSKKGKAVVPLENGTCTGCHMRVPAQTVIHVKASREVVTCENCGRLLYSWE